MSKPDGNASGRPCTHRSGRNWKHRGITTGQFIEMVVTKILHEKQGEGEKQHGNQKPSHSRYPRNSTSASRSTSIAIRKSYGRKLTQREFMLQLIEDALSEAEEEFEAATAAEEESPEQEEAPDSEPDTEDADESDAPEDDSGESPDEESGNGRKLRALTQSKNKT